MYNLHEAKKDQMRSLMLLIESIQNQNSGLLSKSTLLWMLLSHAQSTGGEHPLAKCLNNVRYISNVACYNRVSLPVNVHVSPLMSFRKFACWLLAAVSFIAVVGAAGGESPEPTTVVPLAQHTFFKADRLHTLLSDSFRLSVMLAAVVAMLFTYARVWQNMRRRD
jgi:hypothetical protein